MASRTDRKLWFLAGLFLLIALALGLGVGPTENPDWALIREFRLPRTLLALGVGAGLAVAGTALQALFSNPLCEPYTLGISSGAALGAVLLSGTSFALHWGGLAIPGFSGALGFAALLLGVSYRTGSRGGALLLSGVMLSLVGSSLVALWMAVADPSGVQSAVFWLMGDLSRARLEGAGLTLVLVAAVALALRVQSRKLDALLLGEEAAQSLGVDPTSLRRQVVLWVSILVGACVSAAGMIGFVGLVVPHFVRRFSGSLHSRLIPLSAFWGAIVLLVADVVARKIVAPSELPAGVVTALVGAPCFIWILAGRAGREGRAS